MVPIPLQKFIGLNFLHLSPRSLSMFFIWKAGGDIGWSVKHVIKSVPSRQGDSSILSPSSPIKALEKIGISGKFTFLVVRGPLRGENSRGQNRGGL